MAWRETARAKAARIRRTWECDVCEHRWFTVHNDGEAYDYEPECPMCASLEASQQMPLPAVKTDVSRAVEFAVGMAERKLGVTNLNDNLKPGDVAAKLPPPIQGAESDAMAQELVNAGAAPEVAEHIKQGAASFWGASVGMAKPTSPMAAAIGNLIPQTPDAARAMVGGGAQIARAEGVDPMSLLHAAGKAGLDPTARKNLEIHSK